ncbi:MAG: cupin domain-containing protein [Solirubrobacterales bacterium]|nr:cupin domain-containing protein [Solirubrobacterales bacterium]
MLEVPPGCRLPRHTDSAEEVIVVVDGEAEVEVDGREAPLGPGEHAIVPAHVPHEVRNAGPHLLRFLAVYASTDVTTTYEDPVQPDGTRERRPLNGS